MDAPVDRSAPIVDAHHHLWDLAANRYPWLEGPMHDRGWGDWSALRRNYLVADLLADAASQNLVKSVHVQANVDPSDPVAETAWLDAVARRPDARGLPSAIVAFADLSSPDALACLERHARASDRMRGVRQVLNRHPNPTLNRAARDFLSDPAWRANVEDGRRTTPMSSAFLARSARMVSERLSSVYLLVSSIATPPGRSASTERSMK